MRNAFEWFARLLDYPGETIREDARNCMALLTPEAAEKIRQFEAFCAATGLTKLQELYTKSFDLRPDCTLNASYHLFGDDWRRSIFLAELKGIYNSSSFETGSELPDHTCLILEFLGTKGQREQRDELAEECVIPAVRHILAAMAQEENPYKFVLEALLLWLAAGGNLGSAAAEGFHAVRTASST